MKKQDIAALIDGKIKGQGSAIDIGGALPEILGGLNDNSVAEDMTEDAQMQMRKDLGLYYDLTHTEEKVAEYTDQEFVNYMAKISDETPAKDELLGVENLDGELLPMTDFTVADMSPDPTVGYMIMTGGINTQFQIYFKESGGITPGIYIFTTAAETYKGLKWQEVIPDKQNVPDEYIIPDTEEGKMQVRKNLGLYYEETGIVEKTTPLVTDQEAVGGYYKISDDAPAKEAIKGVIINGGAVSEDFSVAEYDGYYAVNVSLWTAFVVVLTEYSTGSAVLDAGIYVYAATYDSLHQQLVYEASGTVISKVPEKFLPEMGDEVEGNPEVPQGTSPTPLENLRINDDYFAIPQVKAVVLTDIPLGPTTTQAALDAIGLTTSEVEAASRGYRTGCIVAGNFRLICVASFSDADNYGFAVATPLGDALSYWFLVSCEAGVITVTNS